MKKEIDLIDDDKKRLITLRTQTGCSLISIAKRYKEFLADVANDSWEVNAVQYKMSKDFMLDIVRRSNKSEEVIQCAYDKFMQTLMKEREEFLQQLQAKAMKEFKIFRYKEIQTGVRIFMSSVESDFYLNTTDLHQWVNETSEIILSSDKTLDKIMTSDMIEKRKLMMAWSSEFVSCDLYVYESSVPSAQVYVSGNQKFIGAFSFYPQLLLVEHNGGSDESLQIISSKILSGNLQTMSDLDGLKKVKFLDQKLNEANIVFFKVYK